MSIFKNKGIISKIEKSNINDFIYDLFTYDYGKIKVQLKPKKKEKLLDLGYIINCEIETKEGRNIHKIKNIKILQEFKYEKKDYNTIYEYLNLLKIINNKIPYGAEFKDLFNIYETFYKIENINETKLILVKLKIINIFGELEIENKNLIVKKILKFIEKNKIEKILKLSGINSETKKILKNINF